MTVVALMMAHEDNFNLIIERVRKFEKIFDKIILHYDKKSPDYIFKLLSEYKSEKFILLNNRISQFWGGHSQVHVMLTLLDYAVKNIPNGSFYSYISTSHYPIPDKNHNSVISLLNEDEVSFIEAKKMPLKQILRRMIIPFSEENKVSYFGLKDLVVNSIYLLSFIVRFGYPKWGSQWLTLNREQALYVVNYCFHDIRHFRYKCWKCLDESYLQTILAKYASNKLLTYFEFSDNNIGNPKVFNVEDLDKIKFPDNCVLVRKVQ